MKDKIIPQNEEGKQVDLFSDIVLKTEEEARKLFIDARYKLLHPIRWKPVTGPVAAEFNTNASDATGEDDAVKVGDYIRIDIPAPGLSAGEGHDWVKVKVVESDRDAEADESFAMTVQVCEHPEHPEKGIAHFFAEGASSTFILARKKQTVRASYHGRNEKPNLENPALGDKIRNAIVAIGAIAGVSELQWKAFLKGLLGG